MASPCLIAAPLPGSTLERTYHNVRERQRFTVRRNFSPGLAHESKDLLTPRRGGLPQRSWIMAFMDNDARRAVVAALTRLAESRDYQDRADAGRAMAAFGETPEAKQPLRQLLLDPADTFVTF